MMLFKKAFTLVETLVVLMVISLIIGLLAPKGEKFLNNIKNLLNKHEKTNLITKNKMNAFFQDNQDINYSLLKIEEDSNE